MSGESTADCLDATADAVIQFRERLIAFLDLHLFNDPVAQRYW